MIVARFSDLSFRAKRGVVEESLTVIRSGFQTVRMSQLPLDMTKEESVGVQMLIHHFRLRALGKRPWRALRRPFPLAFPVV